MVLAWQDEDGKRREKSISTRLPVKGNKKKAQDLLQETRMNFVPPRTAYSRNATSETLFGDFLLEWVQVIKPTVEHNTFTGYYTLIQARVRPWFIKKKLTLGDLERNPRCIQDFYTYCMEEEKLSPNTVIHYHANIRKCLQYAYRVGLINSNPADRVEKPRKQPYVPNYYTASELEALFRAFHGDPLELPVKLASFYGLRRSEVLGLKWSEIDFVGKRIMIRNIVTEVYYEGHSTRLCKNKTKTKSSTRAFPLVADFEESFRTLQEKQKWERKVCGSGYCTDYLEYVFRDAQGSIMKPSYVSDHFALVIKKNGLKKIRFHDLRHSCASLLYAEGVDLKAIQTWMGHSTIGTTANIYTHFDYSRQEETAQALLSGFEKKKNTQTEMV